mmetsp:Transcript_42109/g.68330  ORF Transcript_42109/g.68330 Transcript_42109/m.68330 type:complete len:253 (+) Transcript_42109:878-1636(+)
MLFPSECRWWSQCKAQAVCDRLHRQRASYRKFGGDWNPHFKRSPYSKWWCQHKHVHVYSHHFWQRPNLRNHGRDWNTDPLVFADYCRRAECEDEPVCGGHIRIHPHEWHAWSNRNGHLDFTVECKWRCERGGQGVCCGYKRQCSDVRHPWGYCHCHRLCTSQCKRRHQRENKHVCGGHTRKQPCQWLVGCDGDHNLDCASYGKWRNQSANQLLPSRHFGQHAGFRLSGRHGDGDFHSPDQRQRRHQHPYQQV